MAEPIAAADLGKAPRTRPRVLLPQQQQQQQGQQQQGRKCARCAAALGRFYNTGAPCPRCKLRVCRQCREPAANNNNNQQQQQQNQQHSGDWLCSICHKIQDLRSISAEWRRTTGRDNYLSALDILKYSIRRAWTINGPPARWSTARKSAEFRLYRSLPNRSGRRSYLEEAENNAKNARTKTSVTEIPIKPAPRVISSKVTKAEKKSSIPVFRSSRSSREFEDIRGPHESPKRSLIPQRYRGSTDDLRRSREDISSPSFIPKLARAKEDKLRRQDEDHSRIGGGGKPTPALRAFLRPRATSADNLQNAVAAAATIATAVATTAAAAAASSPAGGDVAHQECPSIDPSPLRPAPQERPEDAKPEMVDESSLLLHPGSVGDATRTLDSVDEPDEAPRITSPTPIESTDKDVDNKDQDKQRLSDSSIGKKTDEPVVVKRKFSKEELSNDDTDDAPNRRCSSHLSPEASPLSTRSSRYSPRESESEPTPALPRKTTGDRGESSSASQRIRDAITRTRRESNSSAKYESSGSEGVRLSESGISSYVDIARRVKLFGGGSVGFTAANRDEVLQRDSATSAGEDEHEEHARGPASQSRVMLRRRRQFDAQAPRRRGRSHARACYPEDLLPGRGEELPPLEPAALLDYRRLVFISSDSSSGREEDDADSSCSGSSSYLNGQPVPKAATPGNCSGLEDCDWDYFESNSLKLPPLQSQQVQAAAVAGAANRDWSCCPARPTASNAGCCQACGGSRSAKVLPVPVPIPVPVPYPVPVPASLWTAGEFAGAAAAAAAGSMIGRRGDTTTGFEHSLPLELRGCDPTSAAATWFSWNPSFDSSSLLFAQGHHHHMFPRELRGVVPGEALLQKEKPEEDTETETKPCDSTSENNPDPHAVVNESSSSSPPDVPKVPVEEVEQPGRMFRHSQEQDSRSSSGRSSADSSDLEDSAGSSSTHHRFSRVLVVNDDSLTSEDNDVEDNEDSDEPIVLKRVSALAEREDERKDGEDEPVVLQRIRLLDEDAELDMKNEDDEDEEDEEEEEEEGEDTKDRLYCVNGGERAQREIASYDEIYLASTQESSDDLVLLKSVRSLDPDSPVQPSPIAGYRTFPLPRESDSSSNSSCSQDDDASSDSAVMPDSLEVSMQDLEDSIEASAAVNDIARATATVGGHEQQQQQQSSAAVEVGVEAGKEKGEAAEKCSGASRLAATSGSALSSSGGRASEGSVGSDSIDLAQDSAVAAVVDSLMAKSRKKWQIPASFDIKGIPSSHFMPPERKKDASHSSLNPLLSAAVDAADELQPEDEENANGRCTTTASQDEEEEDEEEEEEEESSSSLSAGSSSRGAHDESAAGAGSGGGTASGVVVRGEREQVGGSAPVEQRTPTNIRRCRILEDEEIDYHNEEDEEIDDDDDDEEEELTPAPARRRDWIASDANISLSQLNNNNHNNAANNINNIINNNNKYRSLVMITQQQGAYQPVNVITTDTTTLLMQPQPVTPAATTAYYQQQQQQPEAARRNIGQCIPSKKPLPCKRLLTNSEPEVDSGLSVGSASESDDVQSVKNASKQMSRSPNFLSNREEEAPPTPPEPEPPRRSGPLILEEGLADDDSWVEEISHDEDEQSATTATEESSEDEAATNLGDREEELRGYHRQAIDFTLHTIVEESCEESESEHVSASWRRRLVSASAPDLDKYFFFGLGNDNGAGGNQSSRELDSLSESSSIFSEGLDSISREDGSQNSNQEKNSGEYGSGGAARMEKYFLAEFLGLDQDRRDSDGSVGSDSEGRPSPEAQRRKRLVRARGTGRSHSSSLDNLLALAHSSQGSNSHQNSLQEVNAGTDGQESQSEGSSTETDGADDNPAPAFGTDGQFDTVKRKKKKLRNPGAQSPRVSEDRNKTPEPSVAELAEDDGDAAANSEEDGAKTPQPENVLASSPAETTQDDARAKQQSRDSGFVGSCDDLLLQPQRNNANNLEGQSAQDAAMNGNNSHAAQTKDHTFESQRREDNRHFHDRILEGHRLRERLTKIDVHIETTTTGLSRKDSFNNWSSDEETNLMMSKMRQFFKTMVANSNSANHAGSTASSAASPAPSPSPRLSGYSSKTRYVPPQNNRTKPPQLVYFENELTRLMKTVPGIRDEQVREIVEYLSSEDTWSDSYDSSDYTSSDLEGATAGGRRSALQEQISQSCQQIINKFDTASTTSVAEDRNMAATNERRDAPVKATTQALGRDTAFVYQKLVQSFTKMAGDNVASDANSTPHSSPPLIAKVMHHIGSRLVALMHEVSESNSTGGHSHSSDRWRRYPHHRTPSSASTTEDDDSTSDSASAPTHLPRSKSHDPLLLINGHAGGATSMPPAESEEREASDYERFSWRGSFESALMAADSRTKLSLLACSTDGSGATAMAAKRRSAGDLLFNPKSFSREQLDRVRSCGSIGGAVGTGATNVCSGSIEEKIWSNRRRSSVPDANTRGESGASAGDEDTEDEEDEDLDYHQGDPRATTLPRGMQVANSAATSTTNSLPRQATSSSSMHKAHSVYHFLPQHSAVKSARYRPPGFTRNSPPTQQQQQQQQQPKRAISAPGLQLQSRSRRQHGQSNMASSANVSASASDEGGSLSEACSTPIIGGSSSRAGSASHASIDLDDIDRSIHATRASLSSLGARSDSMASVYSGAGEGRWCGSVAVRGEVEFSLQYDYKQLTFEVHVTQCRDLAPVDVKRNRSDPYVKVYLLPDKSKSGKRKTKVKKHTLNPVFDETLKFHTSLQSLESRTLWLTVWHSDMFGRNDFLGEVRMPLENKIFDDPRPQWYPLQERTEPFDDPVANKGEVIVGLKFVPPDPARQDRDRDATMSKLKKSWSKGALHVLVKEARNLQTRAKNSGTCDPFCKSYLLPDKGRSGKQKTGVVRRSTGSPVWNHTFVYKDVSLQELAERGLELTVWDHDRIASNEFLGGVRFNLGTGKNYGKTVDWMDATGREMSLWQSMLERPNFWVEGVVTLRPNLHNHGKPGTF